jgi:hypothetical protein
MNKILLTASLFIAFMNSFGQAPDTKSHFSFVIGPSFPIGKFRSTNDFTRKVGFAKTGEFLKLSVTHLVRKNFGISAQLQFQRNPFNKKALEGWISKVGPSSISITTGTGGGVVFPPDPPPPPPANNPNENWQVDKCAWYAGTLMVGGFGEFSLSTDKKWFASVGANLGFVYASSPKIHAESFTDTSMVMITQQSKSAPGMSYSLNTGLNYSLNAKTKVSFNIDYFGTTSINYASLKTNAYGRSGAFPSGAVWQYQMTADMKQSISSINVGIGLSFAF